MGVGGVELLTLVLSSAGRVEVLLSGLSSRRGTGRQQAIHVSVNTFCCFLFVVVQEPR